MHKKNILIFFLLSILAHGVFLFSGHWGKKIQESQIVSKSEVKMQFSYKGQVIPKIDTKTQKNPKTQDMNSSQEASHDLPDQNLTTGDKTDTAPTLLDHYLTEVRNLIENKKFYPASAKRLKMEGEVFLKFTINRSGDVFDITFIQKANFDPLNDAALSAIRGVRNFPPIPTEIPEDELTIHQKISFKIQ
jgi:TonB family protein